MKDMVPFHALFSSILSSKVVFKNSKKNESCLLKGFEMVSEMLTTPYKTIQTSSSVVSRLPFMLLLSIDSIWLQNIYSIEICDVDVLLN